MIAKILVPVDFSPYSDAALAYALSVADECGAEVQVLHVWCPCEAIFAETAQGVALERRLTAAENGHSSRVWGRLEFGDEPSLVILDILEREPFDLVVLGRQAGRVTEMVAKTAPCQVVTMQTSAVVGF